MHLRVRVKTNARKEEVIVKSVGQIEISLKEKPERNMANKRLVTVISRHFSVPASKIKIMSGHKTPSKVVSISEGAK